MENENQNSSNEGQEPVSATVTGSAEAVAHAGLVPCLCDCKNVALIPRLEDGDITGWRPVCPRCERHGAVATSRQMAAELWNTWTTRARSYDTLMETVRDINAWIEFALSGEIKHRAGRVPPTFTDGYSYVEVPEWSMRQKMGSTRMAIEGITKEDTAETRNPTAWPA